MKALTVTVNPALDISISAENIVPRKKNRCGALMYEAGGGGINVSRAIKKLGGASIAVFIAGGDNGIRIEQLLDEEEIPCKTITTSGNTRDNVTVQDKKSGDLYRFIMPGPEVKTNEWQQVLETIKNLTPRPEYLIASGSLPPGVPDDFYAQLASYSRKNDIRMVLDTSGPALKLAIEEGVYMCKPNIREMGN
jgi:6-phosphofructokinase 2